MKPSRVLPPLAPAAQDVVPRRSRTRSRVLAGYGAAGSSSGDRADGYTAPVKEKRLCRKSVKDKSRERLAKQPKVSEESLREGMSLETSPAVVVSTGESSSSEEEIQPSTRGLERMSVTPAAWSDYKLRVEQAIAYLEQMQVKVEDDASLEAELVTYTTEQFLRMKLAPPSTVRRAWHQQEGGPPP